MDNILKEFIEKQNNVANFKPLSEDYTFKSPFIERSYATKRAGERMICVNKEKEEDDE